MGSSLFERLGGTTAITAVVDDFSARCDGDARISVIWALGSSGDASAVRRAASSAWR